MSTHLQPSQCRVGGSNGPGPKELRHGLCLAEVQAPVEKGAQAKLATASEACPRAQQGLQDATGTHAATVAVDLHDVLGGVGSGGEHGEQQHLVEDGGGWGVDDVAIVGGVRGWGEWTRCVWAG